MKFGPYFLNLQDSDFYGKQRVEAPQHSVSIYRANRLDVCDLALGMNSGIGSSGPGNIHGVIEQLLESLSHRSLDRWNIGLDLPAVKFRSIVSKGQLEVPHAFRL